MAPIQNTVILQWVTGLAEMAGIAGLFWPVAISVHETVFWTFSHYYYLVSQHLSNQLKYHDFFGGDG